MKEIKRNKKKDIEDKKIKINKDMTYSDGDTTQKWLIRSRFDVANEIHGQDEDEQHNKVGRVETTGDRH